jgi:hypothetical protein
MVGVGRGGMPYIQELEVTIFLYREDSLKIFFISVTVVLKIKELAE